MDSKSEKIIVFPHDYAVRAPSDHSFVSKKSGKSGGCDSRKPKFGHALAGAAAPGIGNAVKTSTSPRGNASVFMIFDFSASRWQEQGNWMPVAACGFMTHKGRLL